MSKPPIQHFTWHELEEFARRLAEEIKRDHQIVDVIVGVTRGGCFPALLLSYLLEVRSLATIQVTTTLDEQPRASRKEPLVSAIPELALVSGKVCLLVDDVTNTGATILKSVSAIRSLVPAKIVTAALIWDTVPADPDDPPLETCHADYFACKIHAWAGFPWEEAK